MQLLHGRLNRPEKCNLRKCFDRPVNNVPPLEFTRGDLRQCETALSVSKLAFAILWCSCLTTILFEINRLIEVNFW